MNKAGSASLLRAAIALAGILVAAVACAADPLPRLGVDASATTVSGVSSGGYMAVQFHVAHSSRVVGAGVLAAGPYYCAQGSVWTAYYDCMTPGSWTALPDVQALAAVTSDLARVGRIDSTENLARSRVWLFIGKNDRTVSPEVVDALRRFYLRFVPASAVAFVDDVQAGHGMVTVDAGSRCSATDPPFINDCDYDAAGKLLSHLLGSLAAPGPESSGRLIEFDQRPFAGGDAYAISLADTGYIYIPDSCGRERCRVHVAFHGCRQNAAAIGERFVREAGYNRWAAANRIVVLYPQTVARNGWGGAFWNWSFVVNPRGCWDWWGYTGTQYHTKRGRQMRAVQAMLERLAEPRQ
ncbi:MAG: PHB depolymerase family esterase [Betaproteobacteria bacterium]|jgi:poly(3-hydroxybutyrate) depolymerase|nr:PHB depolymerase family esterase [Betaproteobacteria bacterium]